MKARPWLLGPLAVAGAAVVAVLLLRPTMTPGTAATPSAATSSPEARGHLAVVTEWTRARNAGDVDAAMQLLAPDAVVMGFPLASPTRRAEFRNVLEAQAIAGWKIEDSDCSVSGETVMCRYRMGDKMLRRWDLEFTGTHEYVVSDGLIQRSSRSHDAESRDRVYAAIQAFRNWVYLVHPDLEPVIWSDPNGATYATPEGAQAMLDILAEYDPDSSGY
jgi:ketosteroid isomerase-like protein